MHGRVKVRTSAEQEALKKKERAKRLAQYKVNMSMVFQKRKDQIYDDELMKITERLLLENPDIYTLWNIRREAFTNNDWNEDVLKELYQRELTLTENCLKLNPKSYSAWHQRIWIMDRMDEPNWKRELMLCAKYLDFDERNFHCWNHRAFVVQKAEISPEEEFKFSTSKILNNFSNYSSWHYRSQLLSKIFNDYTQQSIDEKKKDELELVMNATFTDPNDTSAWFYQRWLLSTQELSPSLSQALLNDNNVILFINQNVSIESLCLRINNENENVSWKSWQKTKFSKLWFGKFEKQFNEIKEVQIDINGHRYPLHYFNQKWIYKKKKCKSCCNEDQLMEQLMNYKQLAELEPDNKWALLTGVHLMRKIDFVKFHDDILSSLNVLLNIDPLRSNYYRDLQSKYVIEYKLHSLWNMEGDQEIKSEIDLSGLNLTTLSNNEYLSFFEEINLGANFLSNSMHQLSFLQNCTKLSLSSNQLESLQKFPTLQNLEVLSLRNNKLKDLEEISQLLTRHKLKSLDLRENPVCNIIELKSTVTEIDPDLELYID
ncbi:geranylgeranyl transferase type-2 subunit alpha [Hylaeus volcanicus]|uniref:geranylgeranyl transferase type-2 subunit alpha n=1 Tax=Hylaeus volcanicus TaxID=313075 RepID=UPI0023B84FB6|nr:geranylgeranyl transferase type-2 subunit alpha [Hylaeus volcanicus]XP_053980247.1 geranylgeranyl transferase type-2 subunit alpha [Hylaeus volcanicus]XP_053980249.1 geranylgeranyl transferase type-2 subunit alpha [Hylaeus volcanicus]